MSGKHDKKADDDQSANLLLTGPIVIRGLGRGMKDALLPGRPSRHRAFAGTEHDAPVDPTPISRMLSAGPSVDESGPSSELADHPVDGLAELFPQKGDVAQTGDDAALGEDRVDDHRADDEPPADSDVEQSEVDRASDGAEESSPSADAGGETEVSEAETSAATGSEEASSDAVDGDESADVQQDGAASTDQADEPEASSGEEQGSDGEHDHSMDEPANDHEAVVQEDSVQEDVDQVDDFDAVSPGEDAAASDEALEETGLDEVDGEIVTEGPVESPEDQASDEQNAAFAAGEPTTGEADATDDEPDVAEVSVDEVVLAEQQDESFERTDSGPVQHEDAVDDFEIVPPVEQRTEADQYSEETTSDTEDVVDGEDGSEPVLGGDDLAEPDDQQEDATGPSEADVEVRVEPEIADELEPETASELESDVAQHEDAGALDAPEAEAVDVEPVDATPEGVEGSTDTDVALEQNDPLPAGEPETPVADGDESAESDSEAEAEAVNADSAAVEQADHLVDPFPSEPDDTGGDVRSVDVDVADAAEPMIDADSSSQTVDEPEEPGESEPVDVVDGSDDTEVESADEPQADLTTTIDEVDDADEADEVDDEQSNDPAYLASTSEDGDDPSTVLSVADDPGADQESEPAESASAGDEPHVGEEETVDGPSEAEQSVPDAEDRPELEAIEIGEERFELVAPIESDVDEGGEPVHAEDGSGAPSDVVDLEPVGSDADAEQDAAAAFLVSDSDEIDAPFAGAPESDDGDPVGVEELEQRDGEDAPTTDVVLFWSSAEELFSRPISVIPAERADAVSVELRGAVEPDDEPMEDEPDDVDTTSEVETSEDATSGESAPVDDASTPEEAAPAEADEAPPVDAAIDDDSTDDVLPDDDPATDTDPAADEAPVADEVAVTPAAVAPAVAAAAVEPRPARPSTVQPARSSTAKRARAPRPPRRPKQARQRLGREAVGIAVLVVLALVCGGLITAVVLKTQRDAATAASEAANYTPPPLATPEPTSTGPVVAVISDGATSSAATGVTSAQRWSALLGSTLAGTVDADASSGMGYAAKGNSGETFVTAAAKIPENAQVVVFFGGAADADVSPLSVAKAATDAISAAKQQAPDAKILVVGPAMSSGVSAADLTSIRNSLRGSAGIAKATWIDPIADTWLPTARRSGKPTDLTVADEKTLATKMGTAVTAALK